MSEVVPQEEERPCDGAKEEILANFLIEGGVQEVAVIYEVDDRLRDKEYCEKDDSKIEESSDGGSIES